MIMILILILKSPARRTALECACLHDVPPPREDPHDPNRGNQNTVRRLKSRARLKEENADECDDPAGPKSREQASAIDGRSSGI